MLRFLRKSLPNIRERHRFLCKTICLSAGIHVLLALGVVVGICLSPSHTIVVRKEQINKQARIVLVPLARRVASDTVKKVQPRAAAVPKVAQQAPKKPLPPQKASPPKRSTTVNKQIAPTAQPKPSLANKEQKRPKKVVENKPALLQELPKPREQAPKQVAEEIVVAQENSELSYKDEEQVVYVGREDLKELRLYKTVCQAVEKEWLPPAGLPATSVCHIAFVVGSEGIAHEVQVVESSKILAYDIAARSAVSRARFEPYARGKKCTVVFKL